MRTETGLMGGQTGRETAPSSPPSGQASVPFVLEDP
jgi:hypothetical protein